MEAGLNTPLLATGGVLAVLLFWAVGAYNRLVALRNAIGAAWTQIDEPLRRRRELLQQLIGLLREPLAAEHAALDAVLAASEQAHAASLAVKPRPGEALAIESLQLAEKVLAGALARLRALLEQHPSEQPVLAECRAEIDAIEQKLVFRRQLYNQAAHHYNDAVRQFPTSLLTPLFRFAPAGTL
ncbi:MAG TPA: LemA family protein [Ideonella sp.]|nr:LemA family protein [Ideonella sp.]